MRDDLTPGAQLAQAVHAAVGFAIEHPALAASTPVVVVLAVRDELELTQYRDMIAPRPCSAFIEPDLDDQLTALATVSDGAMFSTLPLARREAAMT